MNRIASFKNSPLIEAEVRTAAPRGLHTVKDSLVGAVVRHGGQTGTRFTYNDGRTCSHPDGLRHSCGYVEARNKLIPRAERNTHVALVGMANTNNMQFARVFMAEMDRLWKTRPPSSQPSAKPERPSSTTKAAPAVLTSFGATAGAWGSPR